MQKRYSKALLIFLAIVFVIAVIIAATADRSGPAAKTHDVYLSEIMFRNKGVVKNADGLSPDYIEICNSSGSDVTVGGYTLSDREDKTPWMIPAGTVVPANGYLILWCTGESDGVSLNTDFKLSDGDVVRFTDPAGNLISTVELPKSVTAGYAWSYNPNTQTWFEQLPTPMFENTDEGVEAYENSKLLQESNNQLAEDAPAQVHNGVYFSEIQAANKETVAGPDGTSCDWVEIYNSSTADVDLSGCGFSDSENKPYKFVFPDGTVIRAGQYMLLWCGADETEGYLCPSFSLSSSKGETILLTDRSGGILDKVTFEAQVRDTSLARCFDAPFDHNAPFEVTEKPTPGYANTTENYQLYGNKITPKKQQVDPGSVPRSGVHDIFFNEVLSDGYTWYLDSKRKNEPWDRDLGQWIEIKSTAPGTTELSGWSLTDDLSEPQKWVFPEGTSIAEKGYLIVYMEGSLPLEGETSKSVTSEQKAMTLNFSVSNTGETVYLLDETGAIVDSVDVPASRSALSYARADDGHWGFSEKPTQGAANEGVLAAASYCQAPVFSLDSGIYTGTQTVTLRVPEGCYATYTTDATTPDASSKRAEDGQTFTVSGNTVLRARCFSSDATQYMSTVTSVTYVIINGEETTQAHSTSLPVVFLVTDPDNLWDYDYGIYVVGNRYKGKAKPSDWTITDGKQGANFNQSGREWERLAHFTYTVPGGGSIEYETDLYIRIFGAFSRKKQQKGLALIARKGTGSSSTIDYPFFSTRPFESYKSLVLRASGQDSGSSRIRDVLMTDLANDADLDIAVQAYVQVVVYLNGEYWGVYNLREKVSKHFIAQHYTVKDKNTIDILVGNGTYVTGDPNAEKDYADLIDFCKSRNCNLSNRSDYDYVCSKIDVENFALYCAMEIIIGNTDTGNIKFWRSSELDGKWRWLFYDFCYAMNRNDENGEDTTSGYRRDFFTKYFHPKGHGASKAFSTVLARSLLSNNDFVEIFVEKLSVLYNEVYTPEKINAKVDYLSGNIRAEMNWDFPRWGLKVKNWEAHLNNIRGYANNYRPYFKKYLWNYLNENTGYRISRDRFDQLFPD